MEEELRPKVEQGASPPKIWNALMIDVVGKGVLVLLGCLN